MGINDKINEMICETIAQYLKELREAQQEELREPQQEELRETQQKNAYYNSARMEPLELAKVANRDARMEPTPIIDKTLDDIKWNTSLEGVTAKEIVDAYTLFNSCLDKRITSTDIMRGIITAVPQLRQHTQLYQEVADLVVSYKDRLTRQSKAGKDTFPIHVSKF